MDSEEENSSFNAQGDRINKDVKDFGNSMDEEVDELNINELDTRVWLVKVPEFLATRWNQISESGVELGKLRIYNTPDENDRAITLLVNSESGENIPTEYNLNLINKTAKNMYVFSEERDPEEEIKPTNISAFKNVPTAISGTIHHECIVTPSLDNQYQEIIRRRVFNASKPSRTVQMLGGTHKSSNLFSPGLAGRDAIFGARRKGLLNGTETRLERIPRSELIDLLFNAFEKYQYWTLKGLIEFTKQPTMYLREVLNEIAALNKRGPYSSMYSLKPEFSVNQPAATASTETPETSQQSAGTASADSSVQIQDSFNDFGADEDDDDFEDVE
ncbi:hypothetical protein BB560_000038 [Smittium megazygosporum]|uniref:Transcription initiation factor IIF subunit beta n=1 Tax=Smittium megazygosporum TaxID=133381 RepID=A0A2T9ZLK4_9FUNG|nr:hypothetical protein BB560_000038 [Smittium megazygosporum]